MLEGKAIVGETDMTAKMQAHAMRCASEAFDSYDVTDCKDIACYIKKTLDFPLKQFIPESYRIDIGNVTSYVACDMHRNAGPKVMQSSTEWTMPYMNFDKSYGPGWQCVVGTSFGSYVTHSYGYTGAQNTREHGSSVIPDVLLLISMLSSE